MDSIIGRARALLQSSQEVKALELLTPEVSKHPQNVPLLQVFGEALLEANDVETAYNVLQKAIELDPEANQGVEKFLYLGQIIGGNDGCSLINVAINKLNDQLQKIMSDDTTDAESDASLKELAKLYNTPDSLKTYLISKINQAIFAEIEIWMTDLCMEPEAEEQCDQLISHSLNLDPENPEALSLLALIRISQQRQAEAEEALQKSWALFSDKKQYLEVQQSKEGEEASFEYIELTQPLLSLARFAVELAMYDLAPQIAVAISEINDNCLDCFYIEGLAYVLKAKQIYSQQAKMESPDADYRDLDLKLLLSSEDEAIKTCIADAKSALTQGYRVLNSDDAEALDPELVEQVNEMLNALGGPVIAELMPERGGDDLENWEDEIVSDEE